MVEGEIGGRWNKFEYSSRQARGGAQLFSRITSSSSRVAVYF